MAKTSSSDNKSYPEFCELASKNEEVFRNFRSNEIYKSVVETVRDEDGINYFEIACSRVAVVKENIKYFKTSDKTGNPSLINVKTGFFNRKYRISPTTARYIKNLSDLILLFGDLSGLKIVEIGGGYGGLCKIISDIFEFESYTLFDLPQCLELSKKFLDLHNLNNINYLTEQSLSSIENFDLVISNYAFSELSTNLQECYFREILSVTPLGYLTCNFATHTWDKSQMNESNFESFNGLKIFKTTPFLANVDAGHGISLITWNSL
jgi:hypothetical protein